MKLQLAPIDFKEAAEFVRRHHRHHTPSIGHKFSLAAMRGDEIEGVAVVGRPVSRERDDGLTLEVTRLCAHEDLPKVVSKDGAEHAPPVCSFLYGAAARATFALGYQRLGTYTLKSEPGTSLIAAGYKLVAEVKGRSWSCVSRPRVDKHPTEDKLLWERAA